jgi:hypothetical protein
VTCVCALPCYAAALRAAVLGSAHQAVIVSHLVHRSSYLGRFHSHIKDDLCEGGCGSKAAAMRFLAPEWQRSLPDLAIQDFSAAVKRFAELSGQPVNEVSAWPASWHVSILYWH